MKFRIDLVALKFRNRKFMPKVIVIDTAAIKSIMKQVKNIIRDRSCTWINSVREVFTEPSSFSSAVSR
jgi:hypothetical protein